MGMVIFLLIIFCLKDEDTFNKRTKRKKHGGWSKDTGKGKPCPHSVQHFSHLSNLIVIESDVNFETIEMGKQEALFWLPASRWHTAWFSHPKCRTFWPNLWRRRTSLGRALFAHLCFMDPAPSSMLRTHMGYRITLLSTT